MRAPAGEIRPNRDFIQFFRIDEPVERLTIQIATYLRHVSRTLHFSVYEVPVDLPTEALTPMWLYHRASNAAPVMAAVRSIWIDGEHLDLMLPPESAVKGATFALRIFSSDPSPGSAVTVWLEDSGEGRGGHLRSFYGGQDQGALGAVVAVPAVSPVSKWRVPPALLYSPVTQCNLNCVHCVSRETRSAKAKLCPSIKAQIKAWCEQGLVHDVRTDYSGDILWADWKFGGELDFLKSLDVAFHVDTNGAYLTEEISGRLIASLLRSLNVSLDAATNETFQRVRKGAPPLPGVLDNISRFVKLRNGAGAAERIEVSTSFTLMRSTLHELDDFIRTTARCGVKIVYARHLEAYTEDMGSDSLIFDRSRFEDVAAGALTTADECGVELRMMGLPETFDQSGHVTCDAPWGSAVILGNGDVAVCCVPRTTIGNLHETTMEDLWNGPRYQEFRRRVNSSNPPPQCAACPMMRKAGNVHSFLPFLTMETWSHPRDWQL